MVDGQVLYEYLERWLLIKKVIREMVDYRNSGLVPENNVVSLNGGGEKDTRGKKVILETSLKGVNLYQEASYLLALMNPR